MANYNPHLPRILGQEWAPVRQEAVEFAPAQNLVERGHAFTLAQTRALSEGRFYITDPPPGLPNNQVMMMGVYPAGREAQSGPVRSVVIPVNFGLITGGTFTGSMQDSLLNPSDTRFVSNTGAVAVQFDLKFAVSQYMPVLNGKRILGVDFLYTMVVYDALVPPVAGLPEWTVSLGSSLSSNPDLAMGILEFYSDQNLIKDISRVRMGEIDWFWQNQHTARDMMPWTPTRLLAFDVGQPTSRKLRIESDSPLSTFQQLEFHYAALEVFFCEEQRVVVGGAAFSGSTNKAYVLNQNAITLRDLSDNTNPALLPGSYTLYTSSANQGDQLEAIITLQTTSAASFPTLNGLRELYAVPGMEGLEVNLTTEVDDVFSKHSTHVLSQMSLHASGGSMSALPEVHVYGRQARAQVYGSITATQEVFTTPLAGVVSDWPWIRFIARRFGDTTQPLLVDSAALPASTVSISVADFDALEEIVDGWKEVTLRFAVPPSMGAVTPAVQWRWSSALETKGNRWEVLGATALTILATPGNILNPGGSLASATYGAPTSGGNTINLGWVSGWTPLVSSTTDDATSDAFLMFAQDMPPVTGFTVSTLSQPVTGIGLDCGLPPCGIPTGIDYNQLSWVATSSSIPASGFGYYEMQRMDTVDTDWQTIMKATSTSQASFKDYEARVGLLTSYRIRAVDVYEFPGPWSSTVDITIPEPGVDVECPGHMLIFTTNERQDGSANLAYSSAWQDVVEEGFAFPEAGFTQLQAMFDRDYFTAFRPTERGGDQFTRNILVQAAAIAPPTLSDFTSLKNMAWEDVPYICVRDEEGNRWLATILVPSGRVVHFRKLYMAEVAIIEVTATPSPADPS